MISDIDPVETIPPTPSSPEPLNHFLLREGLINRVPVGHLNINVFNIRHDGSDREYDVTSKKRQAHRETEYTRKRVSMSREHMCKYYRQNNPLQTNFTGGCLNWTQSPWDAVTQALTRGAASAFLYKPRSTALLQTAILPYRFTVRETSGPGQCGLYPPSLGHTHAIMGSVYHSHQGLSVYTEGFIKN
ncbi:hypothetical protein J6590_038704 [Homalodisca vitripennis]|nr:hypothetical protein J6590_038704 [Homalodisca vitripennis]